MISVGRVININDDTDGDRIKARVLPADQYKTDENIAYAFPILPKMFRVKPKVGEAVLIVTPDDDQRGQRYYFGPIVSQPQFMDYDDFIAGATTLLKGALKEPEKAPSLIPDSVGCIPSDEEVGVYGRGNSDIIIGENNVRIRSGVRKIETKNSEKALTFNGSDPSFIKLKYYNDGLKTDSGITKSSAIIGGNDIVLASSDGDPYFSFNDKDESVSDETFKEMLEKAHQLPYGDILVDFLQSFIKMFKSHTHKYHNLPPCPDSESLKFDTKYPSENLDNILLSKHIKIN